ATPEFKKGNTLSFAGGARRELVVFRQVEWRVRRGNGLVSMPLAGVGTIKERNVVESQDAFHGIAEVLGNVDSPRVRPVATVGMRVLVQVYLKSLLERGQGSFQGYIMSDSRYLHDLQPIGAGKPPHRLNMRDVGTLEILHLLQRKPRALMGSFRY